MYEQQMRLCIELCTIELRHSGREGRSRGFKVVLAFGQFSVYPGGYYSSGRNVKGEAVQVEVTA